MTTMLDIARHFPGAYYQSKYIALAVIVGFVSENFPCKKLPSATGAQSFEKSQQRKIATHRQVAGNGLLLMCDHWSQAGARVLIPLHRQGLALRTIKFKKVFWAT